MVAQRDQQTVIDGQAGVVDGVDGTEVGIDEAVDRAVVWCGGGLSSGQGNGRGGEGPWGEDRLLVGRNQVKVESEIAVGLAGDTVGIPQQTKTVAVDVSDTEHGLAAKLVFHCGIGLLDVGTAEIWRENHDGGSAACTAGKRGETVGVGDERICVSKFWSDNDQEGTGHAIRGEGFGNVK